MRAHAHTHRHTQTHTDTHRHTHRHTQTHTDTQTHTHTQHTGAHLVPGCGAAEETAEEIREDAAMDGAQQNHRLWRRYKEGGGRGRDCVCSGESHTGTLRDTCTVHAHANRHTEQRVLHGAFALGESTSGRYVMFELRRVR